MSSAASSSTRCCPDRALSRRVVDPDVDGLDLPVTVIAAARWLAKDDNERPKGEALVKALQQQNWDPGVKSLVPFPQAVAAMNESSELTQQLGYAVANRQAVVLAIVHLTEQV